MTAGPIPRPGILDIQAYVGGELRAPRARLARLASNEGALGASPQAIAAYKAAAAELNRYPDGAAAALREAIGRRWGIDPARIVCGSGSDELISLLARSYAGPGDEVLYSRHGFLMYPIATRAAGATPVAVPETGLKADVDAILGRVGPRTRIVFLANPNNPTGSFLTAGEVGRLHAGLPAEVLLVVDAAYAEFVLRNDYEDGLALAGGSANVVVTRTFSKIFGLAALRLGWAYAPPAVADVLNRVRGPFNVNAAALAAGLAALEDIAFTDAARAHNDTWRAWTEEKLKGLGLAVHPSIGNFLLVGFGGPEAAEAARLKLKDEGVLVRQMGAYGLADHLRVTIGTAEDMEHFIDALGRRRPL